MLQQNISLTFFIYLIGQPVYKPNDSSLRVSIESVHWFVKYFVYRQSKTLVCKAAEDMHSFKKCSFHLLMSWSCSVIVFCGCRNIIINPMVLLFFYINIELCFSCHSLAVTESRWIKKSCDITDSLRTQVRLTLKTTKKTRM